MSPRVCDQAINQFKCSLLEVRKMKLGAQSSLWIGGWRSCHAMDMLWEAFGARLANFIIWCWIVCQFYQQPGFIVYRHILVDELVCLFFPALLHSSTCNGQLRLSIYLSGGTGKSFFWLALFNSTLTCWLSYQKKYWITESLSTNIIVLICWLTISTFLSKNSKCENSEILPPQNTRCFSFV